MARVTLLSGKSFECSSDTSILDAATFAGIALDYSCKTGQCSSCKCRVLSGSTRALTAETGLTQAEKDDGWVLSCARSIESDCLLEIDQISDITIPSAKTWPCRINHLERFTSDVIRVLLRLAPNADFQFIPGQYVNIIGPRGVRRSYSLANANFDDKLLELHIRAVKNGVMSDYWFNHAKQNDLLRLNGPLGTFFLRGVAGINLYFLATGTGIAPIKAMLESIEIMDSSQKPNSVTVLWGGRQAQDLYIDITKLSEGHAYIPVHSRPIRSSPTNKRYVQDVLIESRPDLRNAAVYACGSPAMIASAKHQLLQAGLPPKCFYSDAFLSSEAT
jgi:CDP-4-dehydro-6-deoxyglucose reductase